MKGSLSASPSCQLPGNKDESKDRDEESKDGDEARKGYEDGERERWRTANGFYSQGFLEPITREPRWIPRWARSTYRCLLRQHLTSGDFGFRVHLADMQRMHMRVLQDRLIDIALAIQFEKDNGFDAGAHLNIGPALDEYSESFSYLARNKCEK